MKVLFLTHSTETPSVKWRVLQFLPVLEREGVRATVEPLESGIFGKLRQIDSATGYDAVVLQKRLPSRLLIGRLRKKARRLVYEFDDAVTIKREGDGTVLSASRSRRFRAIVSCADAVVTTNEHLAGLAAEHAPRGKIHLIPNAIDLSRWMAKSDYAGSNPLVIGWQGSGSNLPYLRQVVPAIAKMRGEGMSVLLRIVSDGAIDLPGIPVEHLPFTLEREAEDVRSFDIGISPLPDDAWTRGKQPVKVLCYLAAGLPVVASDVAPHRSMIADGKTGFLVKSEADWHVRLREPALSAELRRSLGSAARSDAESRFSIESVARRYAEILKALGG